MHMTLLDIINLHPGEPSPPISAPMLDAWCLWDEWEENEFPWRERATLAVRILSHAAHHPHIFDSVRLLDDAREYLLHFSATAGNFSPSLACPLLAVAG